MRRPHPTLVLALVAALALVTGACSSGGDTGVLEQSIDAQGEALDNLQQRVAELVDRLDAAESRNPDADVPGLVERVEQLTTDVEGLRTDVDDALTATEGSSAEVAAQIGSLGERVDQLAAGMQDLSRLLADLTERVEELERQQSGPFEG